MPVSRGVDTNEDVYPILVDADGRVYVILHDPASVSVGDTIAAYPDGLGIFGWRAANATWMEVPVALATDTDFNKSFRIVPVTPMTSEGEEGTKITDGTTTAFIEPSARAVTVSRALHKRIEDSIQWNVSYIWGAVAAAGDRYLLMKVGANANSHIGITITGEAKVQWWLYETPTITNDGTALDEISVNRQTVGVADTTTFRDTVTTALGTLLVTGFLGSSGRVFDVGGSAPTAGYWLLKKSTNYLLRIDNLDAGAKDLGVNVSWHEE